jgi:lysophospholipase L1-like esterase
MARLALARRLSARRAAAFAVAAVAVGGTLAATVPAGAAPTATQPPVSSGSRYLALGDSVPFGYRESNSNPTPPDYTKASNFVGFPEMVASDLHLKLTNAACPGETTGSMIDTSKPTNGCERGSGNTGPGYRAAYPLHVQYTAPNESQLVYAIKWLKNHRQTKLVTLMIGANDGFLCQETTADHCTSPNELNGVLAQVQKNINQILLRLRKGALYHGQIVIVNYYSLDYSDPNQTALSAALNQVIDAAAKKYNVEIAKGFHLFKVGAAQADGSTCNAGLLTTLTGGDGCGVHPSFAGQSLLASAVERATKTS